MSKISSWPSGLKWAVVADMASIIFLRFTWGGSVFVLFLDALGLPRDRIGAVLALIPFAGLVAPLIGQKVAQVGPKRVYVTFWGLRHLVFATLILTPTLLARYGARSAFGFIAGVIAVFGLCRAIAETGYYPWSQQFIPPAIRGRFTAISSFAATWTGIGAVAVASYVLRQGQGLGRFLWLIGVGSAVGLLSAVCYIFIPGGEPLADGAGAPSAKAGLREVFHDGNFLRGLLGFGLLLIGFDYPLTFVPLYLKQEIGLLPDTVVRLDMAILLGSLLGGIPWGWLADRKGSKTALGVVLPIMVSLPLVYLLLPRHSPWSAPLAAILAAVVGATTVGWSISQLRLFLVDLVPLAKRTSYLAIYYAWIGLAGGVGWFLTGTIVERSRQLLDVLEIVPDPFTPLWVWAAGLSLLGALILRGVRPVAHAAPPAPAPIMTGELESVQQ